MSVIWVEDDEDRRKTERRAKQIQIEHRAQRFIDRIKALVKRDGLCQRCQIEVEFALEELRVVPAVLGMEKTKE